MIRPSNLCFPKVEGGERQATMRREGCVGNINGQTADPVCRFQTLCARSSSSAAPSYPHDVNATITV